MSFAQNWRTRENIPSHFYQCSLVRWGSVDFGGGLGLLPYRQAPPNTVQNFKFDAILKCFVFWSGFSKIGWQYENFIFFEPWKLNLHQNKIPKITFALEQGCKLEFRWHIPTQKWSEKYPHPTPIISRVTAINSLLTLFYLNETATVIKLMSEKNTNNTCTK